MPKILKRSEDIKASLEKRCYSLSGALDGSKILRIEIDKDKEEKEKENIRILTIIGNSHFQFSLVDWEEPRKNVLSAYTICLISTESALEIERIFPLSLESILRVLVATDDVLEETKKNIDSTKKTKDLEAVEKMQLYYDIIKNNREETIEACESALEIIEKGGE